MPIDINKTIGVIVAVVLGVIMLTAFGVTIISSTDTRTCGTVISAAYNLSHCALENTSATGKTMYGMIELIYPIMGVLFIVGAAFGLGKGLKK
jgi:hypothetical protein